MHDAELERLLKNGMTTNTQLMNMALKVGIPLKKICFKDQLFYFMPKAGAYIINLQNQRDYSPDKPSHWVGLFLGDRQVFYFDSYGQPFPEIVSYFAKKYGATEVIHSRKEVQPISSNYCGQFVLAWLFHMSHGHGPLEERYEEYLDQFKTIRLF